jgi:hypothetical protein
LALKDFTTKDRWRLKTSGQKTDGAQRLQDKRPLALKDFKTKDRWRSKTSRRKTVGA